MNAEFYFNRAVEKTRQKNLMGAIEDYSTAIELSSGQMTKTISVKKSETETIHTNIIETSVGFENMYYNRACCYFDLGNFEKAESDYTKFIEYNQNDAEVYFKRAVTYYCLEKDDLVEEDLAKAFNLDPKFNRELFSQQFQR